MGIRVLFLVLKTYGILSHVTAQTIISNACYSSGGDCGFHFLSCDGGRVISLRSTDYGFKELVANAGKECETILTNCANYVNKTSCCKHDFSRDCLKAYSSDHRLKALDTCEAKSRCTFHATYTDGGCQNPPWVYDDVSSYSVIRYVCNNITSVTRPHFNHTTAACEHCTTNIRWVTRKTTQADDQHDEGLLPLVVGVSVGVGTGLISLLIIAAACWIRIRRKPPLLVTTGRDGSSRTTNRPVSQTPSNTHTASSSLPSSLYSYLYSDSISTSHPESVCSLPTTASAASSVGRISHFENYRPPEYKGRAFIRDSQDSASDIPSGEPERQHHRVVNTSRPKYRTREINGVLSLFSLQLDEQVPKHEDYMPVSNFKRTFHSEGAPGNYGQVIELNLMDSVGGLSHTSPEANESTDYECIEGELAHHTVNKAKTDVLGRISERNITNTAYDNVYTISKSNNTTMSVAARQDRFANQLDTEPIYAISDKMKSKKRILHEANSDCEQQKQQTEAAYSQNHRLYVRDESRLHSIKDPYLTGEHSKHETDTASQASGVKPQRKDGRKFAYSDSDDADVIL